MAYADNIGLFGNNMAVGRQILADPDGGSVSLGDYIRLPGANEISVKGELTNVEGEGDDEVWVASRTKFLSGKAVFSREAIPALKLLLGGEVTYTGSDPNQEAEWDDSEDRLPSLELMWRVMQGGDGAAKGDSIRTLYKITITSYDLGDKFGETSKPSFEFKAERRLSDRKRFTRVYRQTGAVLPTGAPDLTPPSVSAVSPADGTSGSPVTLAGVVEFTFAANVKHATASDPSNYYYANAANGNPVAFGHSYNATTRKMTLTPTANLATSTKFAAGVTRGVKSVNEVPLAAAYGIDFTTPSS